MIEKKKSFLKRQDQLQFLRFLAFFLIFLWHANYWVPDWFPLINGAVNGVSFFFILSGLVTGYSSFNKAFSIKNSKTYMLKKIQKIYPLYFFTTIFAISYSGLAYVVANYDYFEVKMEIIQLLKNLCLIQAWFTDGYFSYNGVGWFLSVMVFLWLFTVPLLLCAKKIQQSKYNLIIFSIIISLVVAITTLYCYVFRNWDTQYWEYIFPPACIGEYVSGICLGYIVCLLKEKIPNSSVIKIIFTFAEIVSLGFWIYAMYLPVSTWSFRIIHWLFPNFLLLIIFALGKGYISDLFSTAPLRGLGDISFECFLIHQIVIINYARNSGIVEAGTLGNVFSILFCLIITISLARMVYKSKHVHFSCKNT